jgi:hypothetical protein
MSEYPKIVPHTSYGRVYEISKGIFFPSVTTVLRFGLPTEEYLLKWFIEESKGDYQRHLQHSGQASEIGTFVHDAWESILNGGEIDVSDNPLEVLPGRGYYPTSQVSLQTRKSLMSIMAFWAKQSPKVIDKEMLLYSLKMKANEFMYPWMGRCDLVCKIGRDTWMLDIKTSKNVKDVLSYRAQLTMYSQLWNDMHPDNPVDRMGIIWAKKDWRGDNPPKSVLEPFEYEYDANLVRDIYAIFKRTYDGFDLGKPKVRKLIPKTFSLEMLNG